MPEPEPAIPEPVAPRVAEVSPVAGKVVAVNEALAEKPELVNESCYGEGWLIAVECEASELEALMDAQAYAGHVAGRTG